MTVFLYTVRVRMHTVDNVWCRHIRVVTSSPVTPSQFSHTLMNSLSSPLRSSWYGEDLLLCGQLAGITEWPELSKIPCLSCISVNCDFLGGKASCHPLCWTSFVSHLPSVLLPGVLLGPLLNSLCVHPSLPCLHDREYLCRAFVRPFVRLLGRAEYGTSGSQYCSFIHIVGKQLNSALEACRLCHPCLDYIIQDVLSVPLYRLILPPPLLPHLTCTHNIQTRTKRSEISAYRG